MGARCTCGSKSRVAAAPEGQYTLLVVGLDNAGKTTLTHTINGGGFGRGCRRGTRCGAGDRYWLRPTLHPFGVLLCGGRANDGAWVPRHGFPLLLLCVWLWVGCLAVGLP